MELKNTLSWSCEEYLERTNTCVDGWYTIVTFFCMTIRLGVKGYVNLGNVPIGNLPSLGGSQWPNVMKNGQNSLGFKTKIFSICEMLLPTKNFT